MEDTKSKNIISPRIGSVVRYTGRTRKMTSTKDGSDEGNTNYPCDVYITQGQYLEDGRVSNFWYWRRIQSDGSLSVNEESGYGSFEKTDSYEIIITVKKLTTKSMLSHQIWDGDGHITLMDG